MAEPISPVLIQGPSEHEKIIGAPDGVDGVNPMPVLITNQHMIVRWRFTDVERAAIAASGDVWIVWMGHSLPPHMPIAFPPVLDASGEVAIFRDIKSDPISRMENEMRDFKIKP